MRGDDGFFLLLITGLALAFFVPQGLAVCFGLEAAHAQLVAWAMTKSGLTFLVLAFIYVAFGFTVLAIAFCLALNLISRIVGGAISLAEILAENVAALVKKSLRYAWLVLLGREVHWRSSCHTRHKDERRKEADPFASAADPVKRAMEVLGLHEGFSREEYEARFRTLMKGVHPDLVGPNDFARQLIEARDVIRRAQRWNR